MTALGRTPCDEGVIRAGAPGTAGCARRAKPWVLAATILGSSLAFIDGSVVNVALPAIQADLAVSVSGAQWIFNAYMLMLGALILVGGAAGDRFGRRRVFAVGIALFAVASVLCGMAPDAAALIAARTLQGIGGALMVPNSLAIISAAFPEDERGRAIGTWAGFSALTTALGPVLGGWLVDLASWRTIFFVNLPIAAAALAIVFWRVPESRNEAVDGGVDWRGGVLAIAALGSIAYGLTAAAEYGWLHPVVAGTLLVGAALLAVFVWAERRASAPMMPLGLFRSAAFSGANAMTLLLYFALSGALFFLPFNLIQIQGYSAALAGAALLPFTLVMGVLSRWSGGLANRYGTRLPLAIGPVIVAAGFALLAVPGIGGSYWATFFPAMVVLGAGMAVCVAPLTTAVMGAVGERHAGVASGINNAVARVAGLLAVALLGSVAVGVFGSVVDDRLAEQQVPPALRAAVQEQVPRLAEAAVPPEIGNTEREIVARILDESFVSSFRVVMLVTAVLALASALCAWATLGPVQHRQAAPRRRKHATPASSGRP